MRGDVCVVRGNVSFNVSRGNMCARGEMRGNVFVMRGDCGRGSMWHVCQMRGDVSRGNVCVTGEMRGNVGGMRGNVWGMRGYVCGTRGHVCGMRGYDGRESMWDERACV